MSWGPESLGPPSDPHLDSLTRLVPLPFPALGSCPSPHGPQLPRTPEAQLSGHSLQQPSPGTLGLWQGCAPLPEAGWDP